GGHRHHAPRVGERRRRDRAAPRPPRRADPSPGAGPHEGSVVLGATPRGPAGLSLVELSGRDHVTTVTLNRPEAMNALSGQMCDELAGAILQAVADPACWVMVLHANGEKAFCVGADLKERASLDDAGWMRNRVQIRALFEVLRAVPQPTIASVFGFALGGGCELALSCDFIVCSDDAVFGLPEVRVGIIPGGGVSQLLARRIGPAMAKELVMTGRRLPAAEALAVGLVNKVVPSDELHGATQALADELCAAAPVAVR